ncbi:MAG: type II CAAX endopeptidase family protein [Candidatus Neomarinimicrobiota bacterium]
MIIYFTGGVESALFPFLMFFPGLIAIVFRIISKEGFRNVGWGLRRWWYIFSATIIPIVVIIFAILLITSLNLGDFSNKQLNFGETGVDVIGYPLLLGKGQQSYLFFTLNLFVTILAQSVGSGIFTFGEEFGWRGYLQGKLIDRFGLNRGLIFLGVVWGYWHLPVVLMGYNFPTSPVLGALILMPLGCVFMGIFLGWIYVVSKSIWMPMIAHGAMNLTAMLMLNEVVMSVDKLYQGLIFIGVWGVIAALLLIVLNLKKPGLRQSTKES